MEALLQSVEHEYCLIGDEYLPDRSIKSWVPADRSNMVIAPIKQVGPVLVQKGLFKQALRRDVDCIIYLGNYQWPMTWVSALVARITGKRVLFWTHGWIRRERGFKRIVRNSFYRIAHGLLLYGNYAKEIGISYGFRKETLYVIFNSLDYEQQVRIRSEVTEERLVQVRRELFHESVDPIIICPSRLTKVRGLDLLFKAVALLRAAGVQINILLIGSGPEEQNLRELAQSLGLNVHFYGACYDEQRIGEMIMASNVTVAPGKVGLTAMHSLVYGTPVITHNDAENQMPEWEAIEPGFSGEFFERDSIPSLADAIRKIITRPKVKDSMDQCMKVIDQYYNPTYQVTEINRAVNGITAS